MNIDFGVFLLPLCNMLLVWASLHIYPKNTMFILFTNASIMVDGVHFGPGDGHIRTIYFGPRMNALNGRMRRFALPPGWQMYKGWKVFVIEGQPISCPDTQRCQIPVQCQVVAVWACSVDSSLRARCTVSRRRREVSCLSNEAAFAGVGFPRRS